MNLRSGRSFARLLVIATLAVSPTLALAARPEATPARRKGPALVPVKGTHVSLAPPEGFTEDLGRGGFWQAATEAFIRVREYPGPVSLALQGFSAEAFASRGMKLLSQKPLDVGGRPGTLFSVGEPTEDGNFGWWMLVVGNDSSTAVVRANWREQDAKALRGPLEAAVRSTRWNPDAAPAPAPALFTIKETPGLKEARRKEGIVLYTRDGKVGKPGSDGPFLLVAPFPMGVRLSDDLAAFSLDKLRQMPDMESLTVESSAPVTVAGLKGHEVVARFKDTVDHTNLTLYQVVLVDTDRSFMAEGYVNDADRAAYLPHFKTALKGFQRTTPP